MFVNNISSFTYKMRKYNLLVILPKHFLNLSLESFSSYGWLHNSVFYVLTLQLNQSLLTQ